MWQVKRWARLALITVAGIVVMILLTASLFALRIVLASYGYDVPPLVFVISFFVIVGAAYSFAVKRVLHEVSARDQ